MSARLVFWRWVYGAMAAGSVVMAANEHGMKRWVDVALAGVWLALLPSAGRGS